MKWYTHGPTLSLNWLYWTACCGEFPNKRSTCNKEKKEVWNAFHDHFIRFTQLYNRYFPFYINKNSKKKILLLFLKCGIVRQGESGCTPSAWWPQHHKANPLKEERERENGARQKGREQLWPTKKHWPCSWKTSIPHRRTGCHQDRSIEILSEV